MESWALAKKNTRMVGNLPFLEKLSRRCQCQAAHVHAIGGIKTKQGWKKRSDLAGHYPIPLCDPYVAIAQESVSSLQAMGSK